MKRREKEGRKGGDWRVEEGRKVSDSQVATDSKIGSRLSAHRLQKETLHNTSEKKKQPGRSKHGKYSAGDGLDVIVMTCLRACLNPV